MSKWQHEVANYATDLGQFVKNERLPIEWFMQPDHIALKAYNAAGFEKLLHEVRDGDPGAEDITIAEMDGRRLATGISTEVNHNSSHSFLSITFGKDHHELKFTDKSLADIVGRK
jgi:hypothetical protein